MAQQTVRPDNITLSIIAHVLNEKNTFYDLSTFESMQQNTARFSGRYFRFDDHDHKVKHTQNITSDLFQQKKSNHGPLQTSP